MDEGKRSICFCLGWDKWGGEKGGETFSTTEEWWHGSSGRAMKVNGQREECVCDSNSRVEKMDDAGCSNCSHLFITLLSSRARKHWNFFLIIIHWWAPLLFISHDRRFICRHQYL